MTKPCRSGYATSWPALGESGGQIQPVCIGSCVISEIKYVPNVRPMSMRIRPMAREIQTSALAVESDALATGAEVCAARSADAVVCADCSSAVGDGSGGSGDCESRGSFDMSIGG